MANDTGKTRAIVREEISRSGAAPPPPADVDTNDLPITRGNLRLAWALVLALGGAIVTGTGVIYTVATKDSAVAQLQEDVAELKAWREKRTEEHRALTVTLGRLEEQMSSISGQINDLRQEIREDRRRP